jgi:hypothetical protein
MHIPFSFSHFDPPKLKAMKLAVSQQLWQDKINSDCQSVFVQPQLALGEGATSRLSARIGDRHVLLIFV